MRMSLTAEDLSQIRSVVEDIVQREVTPLRGEIAALRNDIKEIYDMITALQNSASVADESFQKLSAKDQILQLHATIVALAQKEGITLPR